MNQNESTQRGMMKWQAYKALEDQQRYIDKAILDSQKKEKPILSEEEEEKINETLVHYNHDNAEICFYDDGFIRTIRGIITRIDVCSRYLMINRKRILFSNLLNIKII